MGRHMHGALLLQSHQRQQGCADVHSNACILHCAKWYAHRRRSKGDRRRRIAVDLVLHVLY